jgi:hypothetical protein
MTNDPLITAILKAGGAGGKTLSQAFELTVAPPPFVTITE